MVDKDGEYRFINPELVFQKIDNVKYLYKNTQRIIYIKFLTLYLFKNQYKNNQTKNNIYISK
jgi:hypothetical protein